MSGRLAAILTVAAAGSAAAAPLRYMDVGLVAETLAPRPGSSVLVRLKMTPRSGWHGYWSNAGDSGLPPTVRWSAPPGVEFGPLQHPAPTLLRVMGLTSYVHGGQHVLIVRMTVAKAVPLDTPLPITAHLSFAVCSDRLCVPQQAKLSMQMFAGDGKAGGDATLLRQSFAKQPKALPAGVFDVEDDRLTLQLPAPARLEPSKTRFFPDENGFFDASRAIVLSTAPVRIVSPLTGDPPKAITGVVSDGSTAFRIRFSRGSLLAFASPRLVSQRDRPAPPLDVPSQASTGRPAAQAADPHRNTTASENCANQRFSLLPALLIAAAVTFFTMLGTFIWRRRGDRLAVAPPGLK